MKVKFQGTVAFEGLSGDIQVDVVESIVSITGEDPDEVRAALENGTVLPVVLVNPKTLMDKSSPRAISERVVDKYIEEWASGIRFPPIVIDSSTKVDPLIEGGHRTAAAVDAGIPLIRAIDLAGIRVVKVRSGVSEPGLEVYEVYDFKWARR